jgi:DNA-binding CsgD family transcriptional regulator
VSNEQQTELLATAIKHLGSQAFPQAVLAWLRSVSIFDSAVIMSYPDTSAFSVLHSELHEGDQPGFFGPYRDGLWLLSPLYLSVKAGLRGFFHILDIAPANFVDSEYYALYYASNGVLDHTLYLFEASDGTPIAISLERTQALPKYSKQDKAQLQAVAPIVDALLRRHWQSIGARIDTVEASLHLRVQNILEDFGRDLLTPREREVVQLILRGFSSKGAAAELGISAQTEQVHRKNIYHKLGLSSHNQLFSLFFDALAAPGSKGSSTPKA